MSDLAAQTWQGDWKARLYDRLRKKGFSRVNSYLEMYPGETYLATANRMGPDVAPVQLQALQFEESKADGCVREAAMDALVRCLREGVPNGWVSANPKHPEIIATAGRWGGILKTRGEVSSSDRIVGVWRSLERQNPPNGWLPASADDEFVMNAFAEAWPEE